MKIKARFNLRQSSGINIVVEKFTDGMGEAARFAVNESGAVLWKALKKGGGKAELLSAIQSEYSVDAEQAMSDIDEFLDMLRAENVLEE